MDDKLGLLIEVTENTQIIESALHDYSIYLIIL